MKTEKKKQLSKAALTYLEQALTDSDPLLLEAMREVDALTPAVPPMAPSSPMTRVGRETIAIMAFENPACSYYDDRTIEFVMKNGQRVSVKCVRLLGWDRALEEVGARR